MSELMHEYKILRFFWGRELIKIEEFLKNNSFNELREHLSFANMNIMDFDFDQYEPYQ